MRFEHVYLRYARRSPWVLTDVTLTLEPGQIAVVLGRNGAGKTTLLSAVAGLLPAGRGKIFNRPGRVGWVPERFAANQPHRVRPYLVDMARVRGIGAKAARADVDRWAGRLHLDAYLDLPLAQVSKGTAQKVGLIQALVGRPELLVLDEPWEGLDVQTRDEVPQIIAEVQAYGGSVLVSDHLGQVERLPDAQHWHVRDARVTVEVPRSGAEPTSHDAPSPAAGRRWVIELAVWESDVALAMSRLREHGYDVLRAGPASDIPPARSAGSVMDEEVR